MQRWVEKKGNSGLARVFAFTGGCWLSLVFAGIRDAFSLFTRCPCAGRQLLSLQRQRK
jgi:hypothetical protein